MGRPWEQSESKSKRVKAIVLTLILIGGSLGGMGSFIYLLLQKPQITIDHLGFDGQAIEFRVANTGPVTASATKFYYIRTNQTGNSCGLNATFF